jgi:hypothetical protein
VEEVTLDPGAVAIGLAPVGLALGFGVTDDIPVVDLLAKVPPAFAAVGFVIGLLVGDVGDFAFNGFLASTFLVSCVILANQKTNYKTHCSKSRWNFSQ